MRRSPKHIVTRDMHAQRTVSHSAFSLPPLLMVLLLSPAIVSSIGRCYTWRGCGYARLCGCMRTHSKVAGHAYIPKHYTGICLCMK